ncbi:MAG: hypothetical protein FWG46_07685 [Treponema sp.]|nr:hypothetical protein [Treponema sp.]
MKHLHCLFVIVLLLLPLAAGNAQSAQEIEQLLETAEITYTQAAYFTLAVALDTLPESGEAAFAFARENGWLPENAEEGGSATLAGLSLLVMKAFSLKGGMMYWLLDNSRYAYREMTRRRFIEGRAYPAFKVSGERLLEILGNVVAAREEQP